MQEDIKYKNHLEKFGVPDCNDSLAGFNRVGRGPKGNSSILEMIDDEEGQARTVIVAKEYDPNTKKWIEKWVTPNINGGKIESTIIKNFSTNPPTFRVKFEYIRPDRDGWVTETPAIPFVPDSPEPTGGSNFATIFLKDHSQKTDDMYKEMTIIPNGHTRDEYNLPDPPGGIDKLSSTQPKDKGGDWSGSLDIVEIDEFIKLSGLTRQQLLQIIQGVSGVIISPIRADINANDIIDYIDKLTLINGEYLTINGNTIDVNTASEQDIKDIFK